MLVRRVDRVLIESPCGVADASISLAAPKAIHNLIFCMLKMVLMGEGYQKLDLLTRVRGRGGVIAD